MRYTMTQKHFIALAAALKKTRPNHQDDDLLRLQWIKDVKAIAAVLLVQNPKFKLDLFLKACGGLIEL